MGKNQRSLTHAWAVVAFFTLFMASMTYNLIVYPACAVTAMDVFGIGQAELTTLASVTSVVGVFTGIIFGRMLDTRDVRKSIILFMAAGTILFFIRAFIFVYIVTLVLTFLASFCTGICQVAAPKVLATWFPPEEVGTVSSLFVAGSGLGSAGGFVIGAALGIKGALMSVAVIFAVLVIFWIVIGQEGPYKQAAAPGGEAVVQEKASAVYKSKNLWLIIAAYSMAMTASLTMNSYVVNAFISKGLSPTEATGAGTVLNMCLLVGGFLMTAILGKVKRFNPLMEASMAGGGICVLAAWFLPVSSFTFVLLGLGGLFFGGSLGLCVGRIPLVPLTGDFSQALIGTATGFAETVKGLISFILPIVLAYTFGTNFNGIFIMYGICCAIAFLCGGLLIPELGENGKLFQQAK
jgi:NNP family nitrate/nitrite transporter-like MFS transporter